MPDTISAAPLASVAACATAAGLAYALKLRPAGNGKVEQNENEIMAELARMRAEMESLRQGHDRAQAQLAALQAELDEASVRADQAEAGLERARVEAQEMRAELGTKDDEIASLATELETARSELKIAQVQQQNATPFRQYDGSFYPRTEGGAMSFYPVSIDGDRSVLSGFSPHSPNKSNKPRGQLTPMDKKWQGAMLRTSLFMAQGKSGTATVKENSSEGARRELAF